MSTSILRICLLAGGAAVAGLTAVGGAAAQGDDVPSCWVRGAYEDLELRASPYDSVEARVAAGPVKVCYSRPRKLGRPIMGRLVPYGEPWRFGANEATALHMPGSGSIAGVAVDSGWYSLYAEPGPREWRVVVNEERERWGIPLNEAVRASDVGTGAVPVDSTAAVAELMTIRLEPGSASAVTMVMEWDRTRIRVPIVVPRAGAGG